MKDKEKQQVGWCLIPPKVLAADDLNNSQKILLGRILGLSTKEGYCFASNKWLGNQLDLKQSTISGYVSELAKKGYIRREVKRNDEDEIIKRTLPPCK